MATLASVLLLVQFAALAWVLFYWRALYPAGLFLVSGGAYVVSLLAAEQGSVELVGLSALITGVSTLALGLSAQTRLTSLLYASLAGFGAQAVVYAMLAQRWWA